MGVVEGDLFHCSINEWGRPGRTLEQLFPKKQLMEVGKIWL